MCESGKVKRSLSNRCKVGCNVFVYRFPFPPDDFLLTVENMFFHQFVLFGLIVLVNRRQYIDREVRISPSAETI